MSKYHFKVYFAQEKIVTIWKKIWWLYEIQNYSCTCIFYGLDIETKITLILDLEDPLTSFLGSFIAQ